MDNIEINKKDIFSTITQEIKDIPLKRLYNNLNRNIYTKDMLID